MVWERGEGFWDKILDLGCWTCTRLWKITSHAYECDFSLHLLCFKKRIFFILQPTTFKRNTKMLWAWNTTTTPNADGHSCMSHKGAAYTVSTVPRLNFVLIQSPHCWLPHSCPSPLAENQSLGAWSRGIWQPWRPLTRWKNSQKQTHLLTRTSSRKEGSRSYLCIQRFVDYGSKYFLYYLGPKRGKLQHDPAVPPLHGGFSCERSHWLPTVASLDSVPLLPLREGL